MNRVATVAALALTLGALVVGCGGGGSSGGNGGYGGYGDAGRQLRPAAVVVAGEPG